MSSIIFPQSFLERMSVLLGPEYPEFLSSYEASRTNGLRVNTLKVSPSDFASRNLFTLEPVPWAAEGFYCDYTQRPGQHPYHAAGVYYLQEPSAMAVIPYLDPQPGEWILDLAAAPGGKTTHIASRLQQQGLLWANEIISSRAKILAANLDRWGAANTILSNETPQHLAEHLPERFDKVLLDAPCSGEGMFRKDPAAVKEWSPESVAACALRQSHILEAAARLVRPGGRLVYSTCTFSRAENEEALLRFLDLHPEFSPLSLPILAAGFAASVELPGAFRLYPHRLRGEGHFIAVLHKEKNTSQESPPQPLHTPQPPRLPRQPPPSPFPKGKPCSVRHRNIDTSAETRRSLQTFSGFRQETFAAPLTEDLSASPFALNEENCLLFGSHLYQNPVPELSFQGLKILRPGLYLGEIKPGRFQPGFALAHRLKPEHVQTYLSLSSGDPRLAKYLRGESWSEPGADGWVLVGIDEFPLGWAKRSQGEIKNHYPKELRS